MKKIILLSILVFTFTPTLSFADGNECEDGNCKCGNDKCAKGAACINNQCVCGTSSVSWGYAWDSCESDKTNIEVALYDKGFGDFVCKSEVVDGGTAGYTTANYFQCDNPKGCSMPDGKHVKKGYSYPWKVDDSKESYDMYEDFSKSLYAASYMCAEDALKDKIKAMGSKADKCKENVGTKLTEKEVMACVNMYKADKDDSKYPLKPIQTITYKGKKKPSWLIFYDQTNHRVCSVITNSKYDILQENRWCIPVLYSLSNLEDSFAGSSAAENFSERKVCKKGSKKAPSSGDRDTYCSDLFKAVKEEANFQKWISLAQICAGNPEGKMKEFCGYLY